jgi:DNA modification methylase
MINAKQILSAKGRNQLYYGDNLEVLRRKIPDESVDLCYIDPPFNSKRNYFQIYNNIGSEDKAQAQAFTDTWEWGEDGVEGLAYILDVQNLNNGKLTEQTVELIKGLHKVLREGALFAYLISMTLRIVEIHRVLKPTGSFYLHCDPTASHYLKLILDTVFCGQGGDFRNEIIWCYSIGGKSKVHFGRKHDVILFYTKCDDKSHTFNIRGASIERKLNTHMKMGVDDEGREFQEKKDKKSGKIYRYYIDEGKIAEDYWIDIETLNWEEKERLGYPTQKPEALLERIIKSSSNEGDVVLDAYCGCGTTVAVAQRLNRKWIGVDITYQSVGLILKRLQNSYPEDWDKIEADLFLDGVPRDMASAKALAQRKDDKTRKEFEKWAVLTYSKNQARINEKKGADAGIDGEAYFLTGHGENGKAIFQVKSGGANRATIATLNSDRQREKAEIGILITIDNPTAAMEKEALAVGKYKHPLLNRDDDRIIIVTIEEILAGERLDLPMGRVDIVKSAKPKNNDTMELGL